MRPRGSFRSRRGSRGTARWSSPSRATWTCTWPGSSKDRLAEAADDGAKVLVLDFAEVTFVDSMGLGVLVGGMKRLRADGGELHLVVSGPDLLRILEITRMDRVIPLHETLADALTAVGYPGSV